MKITPSLAERPEYQAWVRQLRIERKYQTLRSIKKGHIPNDHISNLRDYMAEQMYIYWQLVT